MCILEQNWILCHFGIVLFRKLQYHQTTSWEIAGIWDNSSGMGTKVYNDYLKKNYMIQAIFNQMTILQIICKKNSKFSDLEVQFIYSDDGSFPLSPFSPKPEGEFWKLKLHPGEIYYTSLLKTFNKNLEVFKDFGPRKSND